MTYVYEGTELELFAAAKHWKSYLRRRISPYLGRDVLEVGAGNGNTTRVLCDGEINQWVCLEPDATLADQLVASIGDGKLPGCCRVQVGTLAELGARDRFDTILYIDVLEHIAADRAELARAALHLRHGGYLVVLSPAHEWLFTPFDRAIGHYRRYTKKTLRALSPEPLSLVRLDYLDSVGMLASLGNRLVLKSSMPGPRQIAMWDRLMVPVSRVADPLLGHQIGKSVLGVWRRV